MGGDECFICRGSPAVRVTVVLYSKVFEEKELCRECLADLEDEEDWIDIRESSLVTSGGNPVREE